MTALRDDEIDTASFSRHLANEVLTTVVVDEETCQRARHGLLDWFAVTVAGSRESSALIARQVAQLESTRGSSSLVGTNLTAGPQQAALVNGIASHALDYDDCNLWAFAHPSGTMLAALLAVAEQRDLSGHEVLTAFVSGLQGACLLGLATGPDHYAAGFHSTGTLGAFGAVCACGRAMGFDEETLCRALSLAATRTAGLKAVFGTMGKHLNVGGAASTGVLCAFLAESGFTAPLNSIEARQGFEWTHGGTFSPSLAIATMKGHLGIGQSFYKWHACAAEVHSAIEGVHQIRRDHDFDTADIVKVVLDVSSGVMDVCGISSPTTGTEGKFSMRYPTALAIAGESTDLDSFTDAAVNRADVNAIRDLIEVVVTHQGPPTDPTTVNIHLRDSTVRTAHIDPLRPAAAACLSAEWDGLSAKFFSLTTPILGDARATELHEAIAHFEDQASVREVVRLATPAGLSDNPQGSE